MIKQGKLIALSGVSAAGKSHFRKLSVEQLGLNNIIPATTRPPRDSEISGKDRYFLTLDQFQETMKNGSFAIVEEAFGHMYGYYNDIMKYKFGQNGIFEYNKSDIQPIRERFGSSLVVIHIQPVDLQTSLDILKARGLSIDDLKLREQHSVQNKYYLDKEASKYDKIFYNTYDEKADEEFIEMLISIMPDLNKIKNCSKEKNSYEK